MRRPGHGNTDWRELAATAHAPRSKSEYRAAALDLLGRGMTPEDVAAVLRLTAPAVLELVSRQWPPHHATRLPPRGAA